MKMSKLCQKLLLLPEKEEEEKGERGRREWWFFSLIQMNRLSELSLSYGNCWKSDKKKMCFIKWSYFPSVFVIFLMLVISSMLIEGTLASEDWTSLCPHKCKCTWVSGRKTADCQNAGFNGIPHGLSSEVQVLDLSYNKISSLTKDAFMSIGLANLQKVFLKSCNIDKIDREAFRDLKIMIELDLTGNKLESLYMEAFESNERLRELRLRDNPLTKLLGTQFPPLMHLKLLDMSNCQLSQFSKKTFDKLTNLETLELTGNKFQFMSEDTLRPLTKLKSLSLQDNPWKCDCRIKSFRDWVLSQKLFQSTTCSEPGHLANLQWNVLRSSDFACKPEIVALQIGGKPTEAQIVYADAGSDITLECLVKANPAPEVKWVRDGQVLANSSRNQGKIYLLHISGEYERWVNLTILKSDPYDAGEYTCVGNNAGGVVEKNLTLNFQDEPIGSGVSPGGVGAHGSYHSYHHWLWILIGVLASLVILTMVIMVVCFCTRKRRVKTARAQDLKGPHVDLHHQQQQQQRGMDGTTTPLLAQTYTTNMNISADAAGSDYPPDLLDIAHRSQDSPGSSASTVPDSTRLVMPQQLNPAALATYDTTPGRNPVTSIGYPHIGGGGMVGRPSSPYAASISSFTSEPPAVIVPPPHRPGYVTLPRRPRVPSWSPASVYAPTTPLSPSPTGSCPPTTIKIGPKFDKCDNLGPRTTADGSSRLSLNKIDGSLTPSSARSSASAVRQTMTPLSHHSPAAFSFAPIQEHDSGPIEQPLSTLPRSWKPQDTPNNNIDSNTPLNSGKKKVPPKPPPKPVKKSNLSEVTKSVQTNNGPNETADDGTEV